jgi:hypothetical protein
MVKKENGKLILSKDEEKLLGELKDFELVPNNKGIFLLIDKETAKGASHITCSIDETLESSIERAEQPSKEYANIKSASEDSASASPDETGEEQKVIGLIKKAKLKDLVEGKFEEQLTDTEKEALKDLKEKNKVFVFKLNSSYKKGVYRVSEEDKKAKKESEEKGVKKQLPDYTLENDGFLATTNMERAKILSAEHKERIGDGELRGIKSFEGVYYLIEDDLLQKYIEKVMNAFANKNKLTLAELINELKVSEDLIRIVCEFLKEDGEILERKKGEYSFIN